MLVIFYHFFPLLVIFIQVKRFISVILIWIRVITRRTYTRVDCPSGFPYFGKLHKKFYVSIGSLVVTS